MKNIFKNIALFGSVQVIVLAIGVVRSKFAAIFLGTQGVGFLGLLSSAFGIITSVINCGLSTSAVKRLSCSEGDSLRQDFKIIQYLSFVLGCIGALLCVVFSDAFSYFTFGNFTFSRDFQIVSLAVFFKMFTIGYSAILQGRSYLKKLAKANIIANAIGLCLTIPIYYFWGIKGITYNVLITSFIDAFVLLIHYKSLKNTEERVGFSVFYKEAKELIKDGFYYNLAGFMGLLSTYFVQVYVSRFGGLNTLGLFVTGFAIINNYVSIVFTAMSYDYFPRISKISNDLKQLNEEVNHQLKVGTIILFPILSWLIALCPLVIKILFSYKFLMAVSFVQIASLGVFFKMFSWVVAYTLITTSRRKLFIITETIFATLFVVINVLGFYLNQLEGLAVSYGIYFFVYLLAVCIICKHKLGIVISRQNLYLYIICCVLILFSIIFYHFIGSEFLRNFVLIAMSILASIWALSRIFTNKIL